MMTASEYAKELNADAQKYMEQNPGHWIGMLAEDEEHWAEYGIYTADELGAYLDACVEAATTDADRNYYDNDNVDEWQEWHDYDAAC